MDFQNSIGIETFQLFSFPVFQFQSQKNSTSKRCYICVVEFEGMRGPLRQGVVEVRCEEGGGAIRCHISTSQPQARGATPAFPLCYREILTAGESAPDSAQEKLIKILYCIAIGFLLAKINCQIDTLFTGFRAT